MQRLSYQQMDGSLDGLRANRLKIPKHVCFLLYCIKKAPAIASSSSSRVLGVCPNSVEFQPRADHGTSDCNFIFWVIVSA